MQVEQRKSLCGIVSTSFLLCYQYYLLTLAKANQASYLRTKHERSDFQILTVRLAHHPFEVSNTTHGSPPHSGSSPFCPWFQGLVCLPFRRDGGSFCFYAVIVVCSALALGHTLYHSQHGRRVQWLFEQGVGFVVVSDEDRCSTWSRRKLPNP